VSWASERVDTTFVQVPTHVPRVPPTCQLFFMASGLFGSGRHGGGPPRGGGDRGGRGMPMGGMGMPGGAFVFMRGPGGVPVGACVLRACVCVCVCVVSLAPGMMLACVA
jgi:hypothetical protein